MRIDVASSFYAAAAITGTMIFGAYVGVSSMHDLDPSAALVRAFVFLLWVIQISWIISDSRRRANISRPFCFGAIALIFPLPYTAYYLFKTRGRLGILWILGAIVLFSVCFAAGFFASQLVSGTT